MATLKEMIAADIARRTGQPKPNLLSALQNSARVMDDGFFGGAVQRVPAEANRLMQRAKAAPGELNALVGPQMRQQFDTAMASQPKINPQQWIDKGMELTGMAPLGGLVGQTVYHGSPHKFDKFDMSKIGTGEGNQAYGHGLYFAEAPEVAEGYARDLSARYSGETMPQLKARMQQIKDTMQGPARMSALNGVRGQIALAKSGAGKTPQTYKVDIPDESIAKMLDWDKLLSEQHPDVQKAALDMYGPELQQVQSRYMPNAKPLDMLTGDELYRRLTSSDGAPNVSLGGDRQWASDQLKARGIPGIRYLDGNSRGAGGTSNYVLFDDQLPRILETNGVPTGAKPWAAGFDGKPIDPRGKVRK